MKLDVLKMVKDGELDKEIEKAVKSLFKVRGQYVRNRYVYRMESPKIAAALEAAVAKAVATATVPLKISEAKVKTEVNKELRGFCLSADHKTALRKKMDKATDDYIDSLDDKALRRMVARKLVEK